MRRARPRNRAPYRRQVGEKPRRNRRRPNYLLLFCIFALVTLVTGSISYVLTTPRLNVVQIDFKGIHLADKQIIEKAASRAIGHNILLVRTGPILTSVRRLSEIKDVKMGRRFPNRFWLRVWERKADAVLVSNRSFYLTQADGFIFHRLPSPPAKVPLVYLAPNVRLQMGKQAGSRSIACALEALKLAHLQGLKLGKISIDPQGDICLNMGSNFCAKLGHPEEIARKISLLKRVLAHRPSMVREGSYIDLSTPSDPAWMPKTAAPTAS